MDEGAHRRRAAMEALLAAAPSATAASMMVDEDEGPFVRAGGLARHLIEALRRDDASEVSAVFGTAEVLLTEGDPDVTNLIQIGFFEAIQNVVGNLHADGVAVRQEDFEPFLGPRSLVVWLDLNAMWGGSTTPDEREPE